MLLNQSTQRVPPLRRCWNLRNLERTCRKLTPTSTDSNHPPVAPGWPLLRPCEQWEGIAKLLIQTVRQCWLPFTTNRKGGQNEAHEAPSGKTSNRYMSQPGSLWRTSFTHGICVKQTFLRMPPSKFRAMFMERNMLQGPPFRLRVRTPHGGMSKR